MKKFMKKLAFSLALAAVILPFAKIAHANDYITSSSTGILISSSANTNTAFGASVANGTFDILRVWVSTGWLNGSYLALIDSAPTNTNGLAGAALTATPIASSTNNIRGIEAYTPDQLLVPPFQFVPSTVTASSLNGLIAYDFRTPNGGGRTIKNGLIVILQGADTAPSATSNKYTYTVETEATITRDNSAGR